MMRSVWNPTGAAASLRRFSSSDLALMQVGGRHWVGLGVDPCVARWLPLEDEASNVL